MDYTTAKRKSIVAAALLSLLLGPLGLFYSTIIGGLVMTIIPSAGILLLIRDSEHMIAGFLFFYYFAAYAIWPICIAWACIATTVYNRKVAKAELEYEELISMYPAQPETPSADQKMIDWLKENPNKSIRDYYNSL